jgi:hypothetical protein
MNPKERKPYSLFPELLHFSCSKLGSEDALIIEIVMVKADSSGSIVLNHWRRFTLVEAKTLDIF